MKRAHLTTFLLSAGVLALAPMAHAGIIAQYSTDNSTWTDIGCSSCNTGLIGTTFSLTNWGTGSNSPGLPSVSYVVSSTSTITNGGSGTETVYLRVFDNAFTTPTAPPTLILNSQIGDTVVVGGSSDALSFMSSAGAYNTGTQTLNLGLRSDNNGASIGIASLSAPYALGEWYKITLNAGSTINFSASTTLEPVPEPATFALFGAGLLGCALALGRRRRSLQDRV